LKRLNCAAPDPDAEEGSQPYFFDAARAGPPQEAFRGPRGPFAKQSKDICNRVDWGTSRVLVVECHAGKIDPAVRACSPKE
jgi:hypothetical protein